jgi:hypothetical protein
MMGEEEEGGRVDVVEAEITKEK